MAVEVGAAGHTSAWSLELRAGVRLHTELTHHGLHAGLGLHQRGLQQLRLRLEGETGGRVVPDISLSYCELISN